MLLPLSDGTLARYRPCGVQLVPRAPRCALTRTAFAAAHVVSNPIADVTPWYGSAEIDWEATLAFRHTLWDQGLHLAEAMDTAQRGMGVDWATALDLIKRTMAEAKAHPDRPRVACGAGTDHVAADQLTTEDAILNAYRTQMEAIEAAGGQIIVMATRALPALNAGPDGYARIYSKLIAEAAAPVILHWLGPAFDPALNGYWGSFDVDATSETVLSIIAAHPDKIDGIKISLLDQKHEETFRKRLPAGVKLYTGDDFNYADLMVGDGAHHSDALLGIFAAIAPAAAQALEALAENDLATYHALLAPTVPLSREIFRAPTRFYKAGIAFMSWLNGSQKNFTMPAGFQASRSVVHYAEIFRLADQARLLIHPDLALHRMTALLTTYGIEQD